MSDWSLPTTTSTYVNYTSQLDARLKDLAYGNDPAVTTLTNPPTNTTRWNSALSKWEKYNGSTWGNLSALYAVSISGGAGTLNTARAIALSGDISGTANFDGSAAISIASTLASSGISAGLYGSATQVPQLTFDAKGRATLATAITVTPAWTSVTGKPSTLAGYAILDAVANGGGMPSVSQGLLSGRPAAGAAGRIYITTDTGETFRDTGVAWETVHPALTGDITTAAKGTATVLAASGVTAGTYTKITVDAKGRATVGTALTALDVTTALSYVPFNPAGNTVVTSANYASYGPSLAGSGATGTWAINISGNAATATNAPTANAIANSGGWAVTPSGTKLYFSYNGANKGSMDSLGNMTLVGDLFINGTP